MTIDHQTAVSCRLEQAVCLDRDPTPLLRALEDMGIATIGSCNEAEPGFMGIEFPTADDAEEFLTLLMVTLNSRKVRDDEADEWLTSRVLGAVCYEDSPIWTYNAYPLDCRSYLDPEAQKNEPSMPFAVSLKVAIKFPAEDYSRVLELVTRCSMLPCYCR